MVDVLEEGEDFSEFRLRVMELIKDVVFVVGSSNVFKHMYGQLATASASNGDVSAAPHQPQWETTEAALFIMSAVARNILPEDNESVPPVIDLVLSLPQANHPLAHPAVRHTAFRLIGELGEWVQRHPEHLERILNWIMGGKLSFKHGCFVIQIWGFGEFCLRLFFPSPSSSRSSRCEAVKRGSKCTTKHLLLLPRAHDSTLRRSVKGRESEILELPF